MTFAFDDDGLFMRMADGATLIAAMKLFSSISFSLYSWLASEKRVEVAPATCYGNFRNFLYGRVSIFMGAIVRSSL